MRCADEQRVVCEGAASTRLATRPKHLLLGSGAKCHDAAQSERLRSTLSAERAQTRAHRAAATRDFTCAPRLLRRRRLAAELPRQTCLRWRGGRALPVI